ncbi:MAG: NADH-ubiquinone oxidoreductase-F iron-sulfur binding region domain-containing protein [Acutalibacteraceae bacterium]
MAIAAKAIGAHKGFIYLRSEYPYIRPILIEALESARQAGCLGKIFWAAAMTLILNCIPAQALMFAVRKLRCLNPLRVIVVNQDSVLRILGTKGLFGKPTALNNVETLANIPPILLNGAEWYRSIGSKQPGTKLFTVCGNVNKRGVFEFPMGVNLKDILYDVCGGVADGELLAVQTGGSSGAIINPDQIDFADIDHVSASGGRLGCGTILVINDKNCVVDIVKNNLDFFRSESCGQCTTCREGGTRLYELICHISSGKGTLKDIETIKDLANTMRVSALCGLGHSTAVPVLSSLQNFEEVYNRHLDGNDCSICGHDRGY